MSGGSRASHHTAQGATLDEYADRIGPFLHKDVAICVEQARKCGVDPGLLLDVVQRGELTLT
jgi:hypothetical protein